ncbi:MAG: hypothetical protein AAFO99_14665 [Bacteroidota bacterium]
MEFRCPKVLEKTPEVMGFNLGKVALIIVCFLGFLFTFLNNFLASLIFPTLGGAYFFVASKFPGKGELTQFLKYKSGYHCIKMNQRLKYIIRTKGYDMEQ